MILPLLLFTAGALALSAGAAMIYPPAGVIVLGIVLLLLSVVLTRSYTKPE